MRGAKFEYTYDTHTCTLRGAKFEYTYDTHTCTLRGAKFEYTYDTPCGFCKRHNNKTQNFRNEKEKFLTAAYNRGPSYLCTLVNPTNRLKTNQKCKYYCYMYIRLQLPETNRDDGTVKIRSRIS